MQRLALDFYYLGNWMTPEFRLVAITRAGQDRCRVAIRNYLLTAEARVRAMNSWVE